DLEQRFVIGLTRGQTVGEHDAAERAADGDLLGAGLDGLVGAVEVDARTERLLHPHAGATGATAERTLLVAGHLGVGRTGRADELARRRVDLVVAADEAGVVVRDLLLGLLG